MEVEEGGWEEEERLRRSRQISPDCIKVRRGWGKGGGRKGKGGGGKGKGGGKGLLGRRCWDDRLVC